MPNMNGPDATAAIRGLGVEWPIFGVTGNAMESDQKTFIDAGANRILIKPLYLSDFESALREFRERPPPEPPKSKPTGGSRRLV